MYMYARLMQKADQFDDRAVRDAGREKIEVAGSELSGRLLRDRIGKFVDRGSEDFWVYMP
jgi:hypothetical protein